MNIRLLKTIAIAFTLAAPFLLLAQPKQKAKPVVAGKVKAKPAKPVVAQEDTTTQPFQLTIAAKGFKDSTLTIIFHPANRQYQGPNGLVKKEMVVLKGTIPQSDGYMLVLTDNKNHESDKYYNLYLDNQHSEIEINSANNGLKVVKGELLQDFDDLVKTFGPYFDELTKLNAIRQQNQASGMPSDSANNRFVQVSAQANQQIPAFINKHSSSPVASYLLYTTQSLMSIDQLQRNLAMLQGDAVTDARAMEMKDHIQSELLLAQGSPAPQFTQSDTLGKPVSLDAFKGKYVLVDFWASWCGPCRMENPNVVSAYNEYKGKNFTVLGVSLDQDRTKWLKAIHDDGLTWMHVSDLKGWGNAVAQQYRIQSIPQNLLIGPDGKIIAKNLRGGVLQAYLKDLLK